MSSAVSAPRRAPQLHGVIHAGGRLTRTTHHPGEFGRAFGVIQLPDVGGGHLSVAGLGDHEVRISKRRHLSQVGDHDHLGCGGQALQAPPNLQSDGTADALAYLATPMDTFVVPEDVKAQANAAFEARSRVTDPRGLAGRLSGGALFQRNYDTGPGPGIHDALVPQQGPNYTLAKRVQRWRATVAHAEGHTVSINCAPSTRTRSVTKNKGLALAYKGASTFGIEIFEPETSSTLLAALLVHDLNVEPPTVDHPWQFESAGAASGGLWRQAYLPRTALTVAAVLGTVRR